MGSADHEWLDGGITAVPGILAAGLRAGIKPSGKKDLALDLLARRPRARPRVFTTNQVKGAPVLVSHGARARAASPRPSWPPAAAPTSAPASRGSRTRAR